MRLFFIRHGQSANNILWDSTGSNKGRSEDPELTEMGQMQAQLLAEFIRRKEDETQKRGISSGTERDSFGFTHLYTSLMVRSVATGTAIAKVVAIPLVAWEEVHECGGIYIDDEVTGLPCGLPGKNRSYFETNYAHLILPESLNEEGWWNRPFEARQTRSERASLVLKTLLERHGGTDDRVAVVSHGAFYMELSRQIFQINNDQSWLMMNNTGISRFDFHDSGEVTLVYHNRTDHLPEDMIT